MNENKPSFLMVGILAGHLRGYVNATTDLSFVCRKYLITYYKGHKHYDSINWEMIEIHWNVRQRRFKYGNLYTYMLCHDHVCPYYEWTYTRRYAVPGLKFRFRPVAGTVAVIDRATNVILQADDVRVK